jgi:hypothetical protein
MADGSPAMSSKGKPDKTFRLRRPNGKGDQGDIAPIPYRLPDLSAARIQSEAVFIPEGEAKADLLSEWGCLATHIPKGAKDYAELFRDADVVLLPDNDDAGWKHVNTIGAALHHIARRIRVLELPGPSGGGDILDWAAAGGTPEKLRELAEQALTWLPHAAEPLPELGEKIDELARLSAIQYERQRKRAAKDLGVRGAVLDKEVEASRARIAEETGPKPLFPYWLVEAWPEVVDGDALIRHIVRRVQRHVVLAPEQALTVALWVLQAWAHPGAAVYSPILMATSAEANSGKTTLLNVISFLAPRSLPTVGVTEAALFRSIEKWGPTLIIDEADTILVDNEALPAVINSGWTRGSGVLRCDGDNNEPRLFPTFAPKAIGSKGKRLPDTTLSRCIIIELKRKKPSDRAEHFRHLDDPELADLRRQAQRWTADNVGALEIVVPEMPAGFDSRIGDNWRLMTAIADRAGGDWPEQARHAATVIAKVSASDQSIRVQLLADIRQVFADKATDRLPTIELVAALVDIDGHPWAEWSRGKEITASALGRLLAPLGITSGTIRTGTHQTPKGYRLGHFEDSFERYL